MDSLGRERAFIVCSDDKKLQLPSDLKGVTVARYSATQATRNLIAAVGAACVQIRIEIEPLAPSEGRRIQQINQVTAQMDVLFKKTGQLLDALEAVHTKPMWFETVAKAEEEMVRCLKECVDQKERILIQWLGMTMYNVWNTLPRVLDELAAMHPANVELQVAMLSKEWSAQNRITMHGHPQVQKKHASAFSNISISGIERVPVIGLPKYIDTRTCLRFMAG